MGGVGKWNEKSGKLVEICTNFEELGGTWEYHQNLCPEIEVGKGVGVGQGKMVRNGVNFLILPYILVTYR